MSSGSVTKSGLQSELNRIGDLTSYAAKITESCVQLTSSAERKVKRQYFTPKEVAFFMSRLFSFPEKIEYKILDPGAGTGILCAAICDRILDEKVLRKFPKTIHIDAYENDPSLLHCLTDVLNNCQTALESRGVDFSFQVEHDFSTFNKSVPGSDSGKQKYYNYVIANPPYSRTSTSATTAEGKQINFPNTYAFFIEQSARALEPDGQMVFISPRSFCSGTYFKKFRKWLLGNLSIEHIHVFESRTRVFDEYEVQQEIVIMKTQAMLKKNCQITVSKSISKFFDEFEEIAVSELYTQLNRNNDTCIRVPTCSDDIEVIGNLDKLPNTLSDIGCEASTGPIVPFRSKDNLRSEASSNSVPLLWMQNLTGEGINWPKKNNKIPQALEISEKIKSQLRPVQNYVLVKRISSKEQRKRLNASVLLKSTFPFSQVGIENHINFIYKKEGELTEKEALGIAGLLNTSIMDNYFRVLNGHNQVNASDLRNLPMPNIQKIIQIGEFVSSKNSVGIDCEQAIANILEI